MNERFAAARELFEEQRVPVRIYESEGRVMVAAPMPGLEPPDISVTVSGSRVVLHGHLRGPHQDERNLQAAEWQIGPYHRELELSHPVDPARSNATYGNGVLVLACPKARSDEPPGELTLDLTAISPTRGLHVGHSGSTLVAASTEEHLAQMAETTRRAGHTSAGHTSGREASTADAAHPTHRGDVGPVNV
jgi:HSP20 family protein